MCSGPVGFGARPRSEARYEVMAAWCGGGRGRKRALRSIGGGGGSLAAEVEGRRSREDEGERGESDKR